MTPKIFYSQNGEDCILWKLFEKKTTPGFFIEIGALDGTRFSNTYSFEKAGWSGICVEAHPDYIELLRKNRPNSRVVHAAVSDHDEDSITFYANSRGSLSTLDPTLENEFKRYGKYFTGWEVKNVPMRTITSILDDVNAPQSIDILSIDIEGTEMDALRGFDLHKYRPRVMVIESRDEPTEKKMDELLAAAGYKHARKLSNNIFYCCDDGDVQIIAKATVSNALIHTPHPCDITEIKANFIKKTPNFLPISEIISQTPPDFSEAGNPQDIAQFIQDPKNVFLISFPRTGSHWLRMLLELYFDRPTLTRTFYKHTNTDYLLLHDHDVALQVIRENVIYLYRNPVDTVYSQLNYYKEDIDDQKRTEYWAEIYGKHLAKWLFEETFTKEKLVLRYEELQGHSVSVIGQVCSFFGLVFDEARAKEVINQVSKISVRKKTKRHDAQVQNISMDYETKREMFRQKYSALIWQTIFNDRPQLKPLFESYRSETTREHSNEVQPSAKSPSHSRKIVGLVGARNEEKFISQFLQALSLYTDAIVFLDDASDDNTVDIVESVADKCNIETIIRKAEWHRDEPGDRNKLLEAGRQIGGSYFIVLDADEMFTANCLENNLLKNIILQLNPGDVLFMTWIQLWRSISQYRFDSSVWTWNNKPFIFCDDRKAFYSSDFIHTSRVPANLSGNTYPIKGYKYGVLHFQFVNWRNLLVKQAWYRCLERIRNPQKSTRDINNLYAPSKDEMNLGLQLSPEEWFEGYDFFDKTILDEAEVWREKQVLEWFEKYGRDYFKDLDIWDIDWGSDLYKFRKFEETDTGRGHLPQNFTHSPKLLNEQAVLKIHQGNKLGAKGDLLDLIGKYPSYHPAYISLACLSRDEGDYEHAEKYFEEALRTSNYDRAVVMAYGEMLMSYKKYIQAKDVFKRYLRMNSDDNEVKSLLQKCEGILGKVNKLSQAIGKIK